MRASDSSMGDEAGQFHTTRWTLVMASLHDQSQTGRVALADPVRLIGILCTLSLGGGDIRRMMPRI
jgi:hypothetical protein